MKRIAIPGVSASPIRPCEVDGIVEVVEVVAPQVAHVPLAPVDLRQRLRVAGR
jgi:hypothetical protein